MGSVITSIDQHPSRDKMGRCCLPPGEKLKSTKEVILMSACPENQGVDRTNLVPWPNFGFRDCSYRLIDRPIMLTDGKYLYRRQRHIVNGKICGVIVRMEFSHLRTNRIQWHNPPHVCRPLEKTLKMLKIPTSRQRRTWNVSQNRFSIRRTPRRNEIFEINVWLGCVRCAYENNLSIRFCAFATNNLYDVHI